MAIGWIAPLIITIKLNRDRFSSQHFNYTNKIKILPIYDSIEQKINNILILAKSLNPRRNEL